MVLITITRLYPRIIQDVIEINCSLGARLILLVAGGAGLGGSGFGGGVQPPLAMRADVVEVSVEAGQTPREVAREWVNAGVQTSPWTLPMVPLVRSVQTDSRRRLRGCVRAPRRKICCACWCVATKAWPR